MASEALQDTGSDRRELPKAPHPTDFLSTQSDSTTATDSAVQGITLEEVRAAMAQLECEFIRELSIEELVQDIDCFRELGRVHRVETYLQAAHEQAPYCQNAAIHQKLKSHDEWLRWAMEYERKSGKGSLTKKSHPKHVAADERFRRSRLYQTP